jgi:predicted nuclease of predicted toxin-antitoxin system
MAEKIKYYVDEHISKSIVRGLRQRGVEVLTLSEAKMVGAEDEDHLIYALKGGYVVVTFDADFLRLHARGVKHAGIVYGQQEEARIGDVIRGLMLIYEILSAEDMMGKIEFL